MSTPKPLFPLTHQTKIIVVDGLIGAGKSTFITQLQAYLETQGYSVLSCLEPVQQWIDVGILGLFYRKPSEYAYPFQTFTYITRIQSIVQALENYSKSAPLDFLLLERSVLTDRYVFMKTLASQMDPVLYRMYEAWCDVHIRLLPFNLLTANFVYLQTSPEEATQRMHKRGRAEEIVDRKDSKDSKESKQDGVSLQYQQQLHDAHISFFKTHIQNVTVLDSKLCATDFTKKENAGFIAILNQLEPVLQLIKNKTNKMNENKETNNTHRDCSQSTFLDRLC